MKDIFTPFHYQGQAIRWNGEGIYAYDFLNSAENFCWVPLQVFDEVYQALRSGRCIAFIRDPDVFRSSITKAQFIIELEAMMDKEVGIRHALLEKVMELAWALPEDTYHEGE